MKTRNISKVIGLVFASIIISMFDTSLLTIGDGIVDNFSLKRAYSANPGYKPVSDTCPYVENGEVLSDNFLYK